MTRRATQTLEVASRDSMDRLVAAGVSKVAVLVPPWVILVLLYGVGAATHAIWGRPPAVTWVAMGVTLMTAALTALTWLVSHSRALLGRCHSTVTTLAAGLWFTVANIAGVWNLTVAGLWFFGGGALALAWNIRAVIRQTPSESEGEGDPLADLFAKVRTRFKMGGTSARLTGASDHKVTGKLELEPGAQVVEDVQKKAKYIESGAGFPAGSVIVTEDPDRADAADIVITDPRVLRQTLPWPGPVAPGASLAEPMRLGLYQDMDEVLYVPLDHHLKVMGMSGSGKSFGAAWNLLSEMVTRQDAVIWAADITKADQTLGPIAPALDWVVYDRPGVLAMLKATQAAIKPRTEYLGARGLKKWGTGCGLKALVVWLEEAADIFDALTSKKTEEFVASMRAARSAGIFIVVSLQRFDHTQIPTIIRGQMAGYMCFGVESGADAAFGLPEHVLDAGAEPHRWQTNRQGMAYLVAPGIPEAKHATPLRTYWIEDDVMREHVAKHPAAARPLDEVTAKAAGRAYADRNQSEPVESAVIEPDEPDTAQDDDEELAELLALAAEQVIATQHASTAMVQRKLRASHADAVRILAVLERQGIVGPAGQDGSHPVLVSPEQAEERIAYLREVGDPVGDYVRSEDPDPAVKAGPHDEVQAPGPGDPPMRTPQPSARLAPEAARRLVEDWIVHRYRTGELSFTASDEELQQIRATAGMTSRTWALGVLRRIAETGALTIDDSGTSTVFRIADVDALGVPA